MFVVGKEDGDEDDDVFSKLFCHMMLLHSICFWVVKEDHGGEPCSYVCSGKQGPCFTSQGLYSGKIQSRQPQGS